jgi:hypothetical protein
LKDFTILKNIPKNIQYKDSHTDSKILAAMALKMFEHCSHDDHDDDSIYKQVSSEKTHMILEWGTLVVDTHLVA